MDPLTRQNLLELNSEFKENAVRISSLNFRMGDLLNHYVSTSGLNAFEASKALALDSEFSSDVLQTNARIARRIPSDNRPKYVSWSAIKYMSIDISPGRLATLGYPIGIDDFCSAVTKALRQIEIEDLNWSALRGVDESGLSLGERIIISHLKAA